MPRPYGVTIVVAMTTKKDCVRELQAESAALSVNSVIKGNNKLLKTENAHLKAQVAELQHVKKSGISVVQCPRVEHHRKNYCPRKPEPKDILS